MKNRHLYLGILIAVVIFGGILRVAIDDDHPVDHAVAQDRYHEDHDDEDYAEYDAHNNDDHETHEGDRNAQTEDTHKEDHDSHFKEPEKDAHDGHDHGEDVDIVEMNMAQQKEINLVLSSAMSGDMEHLLTLVGEVRLHEDRMAHIVSRVPGIVHSVSVSLGENVNEGQILAILDSAELSEIKADYLEKLRGFELARRTFERKRYLKKEKIASEADWLEAHASFQNAETRHLSAKRRLMVLGLAEEDVRVLPDTKDFARYELKSPVSGTIIYRHITRGEKIGEDNVFTVADLSVVWVDLQIPAKDLERVKEGQRVEIISTEGRAAYGKLTLIGPVVDQESRTALGRVALPNPQGLWKPGIFVKGRIQGETSSSAVVVPLGAVQNIDGEDVVFVPDGDGFKTVAVIPGKSIDGKIEILSGLTPGDRYVAKGAFELKAVKVTSGVDSHAGHGH